MLYVIENGSEIDFIDDDDEYCVGGLRRLRLEEEDGKPSRSDNKDEWDWYTSLDYFPFPTRWSWSAGHRALPLSPYGVSVNALHPRGRAFFVSVHCNFIRGHRGRDTFSYDTERGRWGAPRRLGAAAHYDGDLRAWVGLHGGEGYEPDGYLCSCDVPHLGRRRAAAPGWKLGKERLFLEDPERHVDAKLVHMGGGGRFCLVEILTREGVSWEERLGDGDRCVLRLTTFRVEYGDDGELTTTARSYKMSSHHDRFHWQAFWA
ncbi:hypothetical protein SETIT_2G423000v2 [Setaria italica]|nr:hypothetical protein SETIT_2G423000v2 [Setaria italica]